MLTSPFKDGVVPRPKIVSHTTHFAKNDKTT